MCLFVSDFETRSDLCSRRASSSTTPSLAIVLKHSILEKFKSSNFSHSDLLTCPRREITWSLEFSQEALSHLSPLEQQQPFLPHPCCSFSVLWAAEEKEQISWKHWDLTQFLSLLLGQFLGYPISKSGDTLTSPAVGIWEVASFSPPELTAVLTVPWPNSLMLHSASFLPVVTWQGRVDGQKQKRPLRKWKQATYADVQVTVKELKELWNLWKSNISATVEKLS